MARIVNVIVVEEGADRTYFTLEGIEIGRLVGGKQMAPKIPIVKQRKVGGVVVAPSPAEIQRTKRKDKERELTLEERIAHEKKFNT